MESVQTILAQPHVFSGIILASFIVLAIVAVIVMKRVLKTGLVVAPVFNSVVSGNGASAVVKAASLPDLLNGNEFAHSFWLYLSPSGIAAQHPRLVLSHPDSNGVQIFLDAVSNTLYTAVAGVQAAIPYVPLSRWVHIVSVFAAGTVTFYVDGEVVAVSPVHAPTSFPGPSGNLTIGGGATSVAGFNGFAGYIGYVTFVNYSPSPGIIKKLYSQGPTPKASWLSMFGMHGYGVRSPLYRLNTVPADSGVPDTV